MSSKLRSLVVFASSLAVAACGDDGTSPGYTQSRIEILPENAASLELELTDTVRLSALRLDKHGEPLADDTLVNFIWESSDTTVLMVDGEGLVEVVGLGTAAVTARLAGNVSNLIPHPTDTATASVEMTGAPELVHPGPVAAIATSHPGHECILLVGGQVQCRGRNDFGQLGLGYSGDRVNAWSVVTGGVTFSTITTSWLHTCGMSTGGRPYCWGTNYWQNLDMDLAVPSSYVPTEFGEDFQWGSIEAGGDSRTCGITTDRVPMCAGRNGWGQNGHNGAWAAPLLEWGSGHSATMIRTSIANTCVLRTDGEVHCSGFLGASDGQITRHVPAPVAFETMAMGMYHGCGLTSSGTAYCWGENRDGQLGNGTVDYSDSAQPVSGNHVFAGIFAAHSSSCGLTSAGELWCWGANQRGILGRTRLARSSIPLRVRVPPGAKQADLAGQQGACIIDADNRLMCWGRP